MTPTPPWQLRLLLTRMGYRLTLPQMQKEKSLSLLLRCRVPSLPLTRAHVGWTSLCMQDSLLTETSCLPQLGPPQTVRSPTQLRLQELQAVFDPQQTGHLAADGR